MDKYPQTHSILKYFSGMIEPDRIHNALKRGGEIDPHGSLVPYLSRAVLGLKEEMPKHESE